MFLMGMQYFSERIRFENINLRLDSQERTGNLFWTDLMQKVVPVRCLLAKGYGYLGLVRLPSKMSLKLYNINDKY
jgi:hypothetical protein